MKPLKLTKTEFFDVYGISLVLTGTWEDKTKEFLAFILDPIVKKYLSITKQAVLAELRYFRRGAHSSRNDVSVENVKLLKKLGIKNWREGRKKLSIKEAAFLMENGEWEDDYGGMAWAEIALVALKLENLLPVSGKNLKTVLATIDRLNDLEHNNALYLSTYTTFDLISALEFKADATPKEIMAFCSREVSDFYKEVVQ